MNGSLIKVFDKVLKWPPRYEIMVAWLRQLNDRDVVNREVGRLDGERGKVRGVGMSGVRLGFPCIYLFRNGKVCCAGFY